MTAAEEVVDAQVVPDSEPVEVGRALTVAPRRSEVLTPLNVADQKAAMTTYQAGLREILDASDWQDAGRGERFVKKSGWRKIAAWFDLSIELVRDSVERAEDGTVTRASVWARAVAASGRFADGDGYCDASESRFANAKGRQKLENDLRGTAATRAVNRAISNLVGMGAVSAEEVDAPSVDPDRPHGPAYVTEEKPNPVAIACVEIAGGIPEKGIALYKRVVADCGGYLPSGAAFALLRAAVASEEPPPVVEAPEVN